MLRRELGQLRIEDAGLGGIARARNPPVVRCAILCLERALESEMDSMNGQRGNGGTPRFSGCCAVCFAVHFGIQTGSIG